MSKKKGGPGMQSFLEETLAPSAGMFKRVTTQVTTSDQTNPDSLEVLPTLKHYTESPTEATYRPTVSDLQEHKNRSRLTEDEPVKKKVKDRSLKFGWIQGVLIRCILNIFGVILFLRLSWMTGQAGIGLGTVIVVVATIFTTVTTISMSVICTNGIVEGGGAYYMISRSLGPEFGGAFGIIFSLVNALAAAMHIVGFAETVVDFMEERGVGITGNNMNDIRIIGCSTAVVLLAIVIIGMQWEAKAQNVLLVILFSAVANFCIGTFLPPTEDQRSKGFVGYKADVFLNNFGPDFRDGETFFTIFAVFFPAATGILAGANISGDLRDAQSAIPKGTLWSIFVTSAVYMVMHWLCGAVILRDAAGPIMANATLNYTMEVVTLLNGSTPDYPIPACRATESCKYGLLNNYTVVRMASGWGPLVLAGIFSASLSSGLASLVGAPKIFQAVCKDKLFPGIHYFAKGFGRNGDPWRGYILCFFIAVAVACIADLNIIAPLVSNFFLMAHTIINFSVFNADMAKSPGWRPSFKFYNKWVSLVGAIMCLAVMFMMNWWAALITLAFVIFLYSYVHFRKTGKNWGSSIQAQAYQVALENTLKLDITEEHVKNFRPQILVLSGEPQYRPDLVLFAAEITKKQSLLMCGHIIEGSQDDHKDTLKSRKQHEWLEKNKIKAFYCRVTSTDFQTGARVLQQVGGLGKLKPNILMLGFKSDWATADKADCQQYSRMIHDAFNVENGVGVFRVAEGFDRRGKATDNGTKPYENGTDNDTDGGVENPAYSDGVDGKLGKSGKKKEKDEVIGLSMTRFSQKEQTNGTGMTKNDSEEFVIDIDGKTPAMFGSKAKQTGTIDVWWLFDDGGLTLLLPFILSKKTNWKNCKMRIFGVGSRLTRNKDHERMTTLLTKFRIEYSELNLITDLGKTPSDDSIDLFDNLIKDLKTDEKEEESPCKRLTISEAQLKKFQKQTHRQIRLKELLQEHTRDDTRLIAMTLPMPQTDLPTGLYMAWLDVLTRDMPPFLLVRGNQQNVLTFYS